MNKKCFSVAFAVLVTLAFSAADARDLGSPPISREAGQELRELERTAVAMKADADRFQSLRADLQVSPELQGVQLTALKEDINRMGVELRSLDAEREALPPWEQEAVDRTLPLLKDAAANTESAIDFLTHNRARLWAPAYRDCADRVWKDSQQLATMLKGYVQIANLHEWVNVLDQSPK